jgi:hypothetical protein
MVVLVNNETRFTVTIFGIKRNQFKDIKAKMMAAIRNTLLSMNLYPDMVEEYLRKAGEIEFVANHSRQFTAWVNRQGNDARSVVNDAVHDSVGTIKYDDTLGESISRNYVNVTNNINDRFKPSDKMIKALIELTGKPAYKYDAFEILITLDLKIYKATRRLIVPADIAFSDLHKLIQQVFGWKNHHLHDFSIVDDRNTCISRLVMTDEDLSYEPDAILETGLKLSNYFPKYERIVYTYDMGDNWEHEIKLVRVIKEHSEESPYLLEAIGQTPPEDVGGIYGYIDFHEIMSDPANPEYERMKSWAHNWTPELREWDARPKVIDIY